MPKAMCITVLQKLVLLGLVLSPVATYAAGSEDTAKVGPPLETVKAFEDNFRLVGIGVSAKGRVFATAPSGQARPVYNPPRLGRGRGTPRRGRGHSGGDLPRADAREHPR